MYTITLTLGFFRGYNITNKCKLEGVKMDTIRLKAKAKINLTLDVIGKMDNGYHDLRMVMQTINLHDTIQVTKTKTPKIQINTNIKWLPTDERNVAHKATALFCEKMNIDDGVYIDILKRIPVSAGLAGGSSDAAAVLVGLNKLFGTNLSKKQLMELGVQIGADVPFCILRGTVLAEGIGDILTTLNPLPYSYVLLVKPNINVSTAQIYQTLSIPNIKKHPKTDDVVNAINNGNTSFVFKNMYNVLQEVTETLHPQIKNIQNDMMELGAISSMMSGSGPTVFGVFETRQQCLEAAIHFKMTTNFREVYATTTYSPISRKEGLS